MKFLTILPFIFIGSSLSSSAISHESSLSSPSIPLVNWLFSKTPASEEQNLWEKVKVPHCWNATDAQHGNGKEDNLHYGYYRGAGTYKTTLPPSKQYKGNQVYVRFNAISNFAEIYINGVKAGEHAGAFGAFGYRITDMLHQDKPNTLEVRANNAFRKDILPISGDFPVYGGMYRPVTIELRPNICISPIRDGSWGVQTTQSSSEQSFKLNIKTNIDNQTGTSQQGTLTIKLHDKNKQLVQIKKTVTIPRGDSTISETLPIQNPHLWNGVQDPYLHTLTVQIQANGITNQAKPVKIGFRNIDFSPDKGLFLNGKPLKIHGVCRHQDRENLGWALSAKHHLEDVQIMQEMGVNAVRLAHYPQAEELLDALDECGILVWAEIPYVDSIGKPKADGVEQITKQQLKEMIRQQINHPSIMVWGLSNELMQRSTDDPLPLMRELNALAHQEDPSRKTTCAVNRIGNTALCSITDTYGRNTYPGWYGGAPEGMGNDINAVREKYPNTPWAISEYGSGASIKQHERGINKAPSPTGKWHPEEWQCRAHEKNWEKIAAQHGTWGTFIWNMFDFASVWRNEGDRPGINDKGLVTFDHQTKKDAFYFYKANWRKDIPVVYIQSRRATPTNEKEIVIKFYSNLSKHQVTLNGRLIKNITPYTTLNGYQTEKLSLNSGKNIITVTGEDPIKGKSKDKVIIVHQ